MMNMKLYGITTGALALWLVATTARAVVITPVSVTASHERLDLDRGAIRTIDGSGLVAAGGPGVLDDQHNFGAGGTMWLATATPSSVSITWNLGASYDLVGFHLWNYNEGGSNPLRGVDTADILVSDDPTFTIGVTTFAGFDLLVAPGNPAYTGEDYLLPSIAAGQYVRFQNLANFPGSDGHVGLSEIRFDVVAPEPTSVALLGVGGALLWFRRRNHRV